MDSVDTALNLIERYAKLAYLSNGEFLGNDIRDKQVYLSGPITGEKNYKGLICLNILRIGTNLPEILLNLVVLRRFIAPLYGFQQDLAGNRQ